MAWVNPIVDRSQTDIDEGTNKAYLNASDILRIENNAKYLFDTLTAYHYLTTYTGSGVTWTRSSYLYMEQLNVIIENINKLKDTYSVEGVPVLTTKTFPCAPTYTNINDIEKNQLELKKNIVDMEGSFKRCGTFSAGATFIFQQKGV